VYQLLTEWDAKYRRWPDKSARQPAKNARSFNRPLAPQPMVRRASCPLRGRCPENEWSLRGLEAHATPALHLRSLCGCVVHGGSGFQPVRNRPRFRSPRNRATIPTVSDDRVRSPWPFRWRCRSLPLTLILPPSLSLTLFRVGAGDSKARGRLAEDGFDRDGAAAWQGNRDSPIVETSTGKLRREV
jgi:hypothetical protein